MSEKAKYDLLARILLGIIVGFFLGVFSFVWFLSHFGTWDFVQSQTFAGLAVAWLAGLPIYGGLLPYYSRKAKAEEHRDLSSWKFRFGLASVLSGAVAGGVLADFGLLPGMGVLYGMIAGVLLALGYIIFAYGF